MGYWGRRQLPTRSWFLSCFSRNGSFPCCFLMSVYQRVNGWDSTSPRCRWDRSWAKCLPPSGRLVSFCLISSLSPARQACSSLDLCAPLLTPEVSSEGVTVNPQKRRNSHCYCGRQFQAGLCDTWAGISVSVVVHGF